MTGSRPLVGVRLRGGVQLVCHPVIVVLPADARQLRVHGRRVRPQTRLAPAEMAQARQRMVNVLARAAGRPCATPPEGPDRRWLSALASVAVMIAVVGAAVMAVAL